MSDDFYLMCKEHGEAVHLTDNKLNAPRNKDSLKLFLTYHFGHNIILQTEHVVDYNDIKRWNIVYNKSLSCVHSYGFDVVTQLERCTKCGFSRTD